MAEDDIAHGEFFQHRGRDFTRVCPHIVFVHVLRSQAKVGIQNRLRNLAQRGERRTHDNIHLFDIRQFQFEIAHQGQRLGDGLVHLPVAGHDEFAIFVHLEVVMGNFIPLKVWVRRG